MIMLIIAIPLSQTEIMIVNDLNSEVVVDRRKVWKEEFTKVVYELYQVYHVTDIQIFGPFTYIDGLAHQIQEAMPYDDYEITVNIDNDMTENAPQEGMLDVNVGQKLVGLDGKTLSSEDESKLLGV